MSGYTLGRQLRRLRIRAGLNGRDLAERIGTSQPWVSRIETGKIKPKVELVRAWCDATDATAAIRTKLLQLAEDNLVDDASGFGDEEHHFIVSVNLRGHDANWSSDLIPQEVRAYDLPTALHRAAELPLFVWFPFEEEEDK